MRCAARRGAWERALACGRPALINVITNPAVAYPAPDKPRLTRGAHDGRDRDRAGAERSVRARDRPRVAWHVSGVRCQTTNVSVGCCALFAGATSGAEALAW
jgi:hypothetical protein